MRATELALHPGGMDSSIVTGLCIGAERAEQSNAGTQAMQTTALPAQRLPRREPAAELGAPRGLLLASVQSTNRLAQAAKGGQNVLIL
jgi:hypothetical protein